MAHVKVVERWEDGKPTPIPPAKKSELTVGGGDFDPFFTVVYVDDYLPIRVQHSDGDTTALKKHGLGQHDRRVRLYDPLSRHENSVPREKIEAIQRMLFEQWPQSRREAARDVLSMAGKLWNLTYVVRAGRHFVRRLLRLTGLHNSGGSKNQNMAGKLWNLTYVVPAGRYFVRRLLRLPRLHNSGGSKNQNRTVELDREFDADLLFWKLAIDHKLIHEGEVLSAPCYTAIQRPAKRHYLSDASFEAVDGFCVERKVFWR